MNELKIIYLLIAAIVISKIIIGFLIVYLVKRKRELKREKTKLHQSNLALEAHIEKIEEQQKEIIASENFKLKILSLASHDLRTPFQELVMLFEYADLAELSDTELKNLMLTIRKQVKVSKDMLDNVLVWTAGQLKNKEYANTNFELAFQVDATADLFATQIKAKEIAIQNKIPRQLRSAGNVEVFNFVIRNLLSNAIKYSSVGGTVEIGVLEKDGLVSLLYIRDEGEGIEERVLQVLRSGQLMESKVGTEQEKGVGLGLSLCRDLLKRVGWSLEIDSELGRGSCFKLQMQRENTENNNVVQFVNRPQTGTSD